MAHDYDKDDLKGSFQPNILKKMYIYVSDSGVRLQAYQYVVSFLESKTSRLSYFDVSVFRDF